MLKAIVNVVRGEGLQSAGVRAAERMSETWERQLRLVRGTFATMPHPRLVNLPAISRSSRFGGVAVQLNARLAEERHLRDVAIYDRGVLEVEARAWRTEIVDAGAVVLEGAFGSMPSLPKDGVELVVAVHDFSLLSADPHRLEVDEARLDAVQRLFDRARAVVLPSRFLLGVYRNVVPRFAARVIEPGIVDVAVEARPIRNRVAFVGSVKPHKGGALLGEIMRSVSGAEWHLFGGGDADLLGAIPRAAAIHGYYRAGALPRLLAHHGIGLAVLPSIVPESFSLTLSECWSAGVPVVAFDHGAVGERIAAHGGGFLVPPEAGAAGIAARVREWLDGVAMDGAWRPTPTRVPTARDAAAAHVALYRELGIL